MRKNSESAAEWVERIEKEGDELFGTTATEAQERAWLTQQVAARDLAIRLEVVERLRELLNERADEFCDRYELETACEILTALESEIRKAGES